MYRAIANLLTDARYQVRYVSPTVVDIEIDSSRRAQADLSPAAAIAHYGSGQ